ncbi:MAG: uroporphyrinogen-III C-methyltransferase [Desulfuromonadia bacterium]
MSSETDVDKSTSASAAGIVYLVGGGPGDPGLLTIRGRECLCSADVVVYDYLVNPQILRHARADAQLVYAGKIGGAHNQDQENINRLLIHHAREGKVVCRLKGGDPFVFGRGGEECEALVSAGIPFEVVPGVTAAIGAAAYAGIPLTHRRVATSVAFVTGHEDPSKDESQTDWEKLSLGSGTVVFYMGVRSLASISRNLIAHGRPPWTPAAIVRWGTRPEQEVVVGTLEDIAPLAARLHIKPPAVVIVGEVVSLRDRLRWFDNRPLFGRTILVTRAADQASTFSTILSSRGARVVECPTIQLVPPPSWEELDRSILSLSGYDWLILTSVNGVNFFFDRLAFHGLDSRALASCRVCGVGTKTAAAIRARGVIPDLIPGTFTGEGVVEEFRRLGVSGGRVLFPRGDLARDVVARGLSSLGMTVDSPVAYANRIPTAIPEEVLELLERRRVDCVTFTSSSTVDNLRILLGADRFISLLEGVTVAAIGPVTADTCRRWGLTVTISPRTHTLEALTDAIVDHFRKE